MGLLHPISQAEIDARLTQVTEIARELGFVGRVEYRHVVSASGGASYCLAPTIEEDLLVVYAEAFSRDAAGDDFSLGAIIAHERGHQILDRDERLLRVRPGNMSETTEEVLASLIGALIAGDPIDRKALEYKALCQLVTHGMKLTEASRIVETNLEILRKAL